MTDTTCTLLDDPATYRAAAAELAERVGGAGLHGLVNNAGVTVSAPLEFLPLEQLRAQLETNLVGLGVTQAVLPLLRTARGRVVSVSSVGGFVAGPVLGAYHASKFGLEAVSDTLRRELRHLGVAVSVVGARPRRVARPHAAGGGAGARPVRLSVT